MQYLNFSVNSLNQNWDNWHSSRYYWYAAVWIC